MGFLDSSGLAHLWEKVKSALSGKQDRLSGVSGQMVGFGEDGGAAALDPDAALVGLLAPLSTKSTTSTYSSVRVPFYYEKEGAEAETGVYYISFTTLQRWTVNRTSAVGQSNSDYTTYMARGISLTTSAPSSLTNGTICCTYA